MSFKDVLGFVFSLESDEPVMHALEVLSGGENRATAVLLELQPEPAYLADGVLASAAWAQVSEQLQADFDKEYAELERRCRNALFPVSSRTLLASTPVAGAEAAVVARHADLSVMLRPGGTWPEDFRTKLFESVLFGSGRPVLLIPPKWCASALGRRVVVGWNGKREAARALGDAMPMLRNAEEVIVVTVDAHAEFDGCGEARGEDITAHLARAGLKATLRNIDGLGRDSGEALLAEAKAIEADVMVIGGYGKARMREFVFGGVTRALSQRSTIPVFLSH